MTADNRVTNPITIKLDLRKVNEFKTPKSKQLEEIGQNFLENKNNANVNSPL